MIDRATAKSMDCYVEMQTLEDAATTVSRLTDNLRYGKKPRVQDRAVKIELSNMEALMAELLPRAKCVYWEGPYPCITPNSQSFGSGFRGFVQLEEMHLTQQWAEKPQRVSRSTKLPH